MIADLIGVLSIMVGSGLLVGAFVLPKQRRKNPPIINATLLPSLRDERIPPRYQAKKLWSKRWFGMMQRRANVQAND
jgi:hypothetical protein